MLLRAWVDNGFRWLVAGVVMMMMSCGSRKVRLAGIGWIASAIELWLLEGFNTGVIRCLGGIEMFCYQLR